VIPAQARRTTTAIYALLLLETVVSTSFVPLAPTFAHRLALSATESGAALAIVNVPLLLASASIGALCDRLSGRSLTIAAAVLLTLSAVAQGFAFAFWWLLLLRLVFGIGNALLWTAGLAWLVEAMPPPRQSRALSSTVTVSAVGAVIGPTFAGFVAQHLGLEAPFAAAAAALGLVTAALLVVPAVERPARKPEPFLTDILAVRKQPLIVGAMVVLALSGLSSGAVNLLVPLQLERNGLSAAEVGLALSSAWLLFTAGSAVVARFSDRVASLRVASAAALVLTIALVPVIASTSTSATFAFLLLRVPVWAFLATAPYALVARGTNRSAVGSGVAIGAVTQVWALAASVAPVAAGALAEGAGTRWAYLALAVVAAVMAPLVLAAGMSQRRPEVPSTLSR